ncbi:hypothetical protein FGB62_194g09 [Gracilaria domingensis]|nr:hypothetical protein FGB62_194g09 [Gracilaria domingensis]
MITDSWALRQVEGVSLPSIEHAPSYDRRGRATNQGAARGLGKVGADCEARIGAAAAARRIAAKPHRPPSRIARRAASPAEPRQHARRLPAQEPAPPVRRAVVPARRLGHAAAHAAGQGGARRQRRAARCARQAHQAARRPAARLLLRAAAALRAQQGRVVAALLRAPVREAEDAAVLRRHPRRHVQKVRRQGRKHAPQRRRAADPPAGAAPRLVSVPHLLRQDARAGAPVDLPRARAGQRRRGHRQELSDAPRRHYEHCAAPRAARAAGQPGERADPKGVRLRRVVDRVARRRGGHAALDGDRPRRAVGRPGALADGRGGARHDQSGAVPVYPRRQPQPARRHARVPMINAMINTASRYIFGENDTPQPHDVSELGPPWRRPETPATHRPPARTRRPAR